MLWACYALLLVCTLMVGALTWLNWRRFRGIEFLGIGLLLYYYSLFGAWNVLALKGAGGESDALDHLEHVLFPVHVDGNYFLAIAIYGLFDVLLLAGLYMMPRRAWPRDALQAQGSTQAGAVSALSLAVVALVAMGGSGAALWGEITSALDQGVPVYLFTRADPGPLFTLHQLLNRVGLAALACAWPLLALDRGPATWRITAVALLLPSTGAWLAYLGMLGNRNEIIVAVLAGLYLHISLGGQLRLSRLVLVAGAAFLALRTIETLRAVPVAQMVGVFLDALLDPQFWNPGAVAGGSESLAAHLSLYGVLSADLPWTWGSSLVYLAQSLVPGWPAASRVADSYAVYASGVGAPDGQGFNIHFAAGAYLNLGIAGVVIAAAALALLVRSLRSWSQSLADRPGDWRLLPAMTGNAFLCALLPIAMRGGPEGLKALLFEGYLIPFLVATLVSLPLWRRPRPSCAGVPVIEGN